MGHEIPSLSPPAGAPAVDTAGQIKTKTSNACRGTPRASGLAAATVGLIIVLVAGERLSSPLFPSAAASPAGQSARLPLFRLYQQPDAARAPPWTASRASRLCPSQAGRSRTSEFGCKKGFPREAARRLGQFLSRPLLAGGARLACLLSHRRGQSSLLESALRAASRVHEFLEVHLAPSCYTGKPC